MSHQSKFFHIRNFFLLALHVFTIFVVIKKTYISFDTRISKCNFEITFKL